MINRTSVTLALFAALSIALPFTARAEETSARVQLAVQSVCGEGAHLFNISNAGTVTSSALNYKVTAKAYKSMPALYTWNLRLMPLQPGQVFQLSIPKVAWGLKIFVEIEAAQGLDVTQSADIQEGVSYPTFCW